MRQPGVGGMRSIAIQLCEICTKSEVVSSLMLTPVYVVQLVDWL